jgi:hypothetical protein
VINPQAAYERVQAAKTPTVAFTRDEAIELCELALAGWDSECQACRRDAVTFLDDYWPWCGLSACAAKLRKRNKS